MSFASTLGGVRCTAAASGAPSVCASRAVPRRRATSCALHAGAPASPVMSGPALSAPAGQPGPDRPAKAVVSGRPAAVYTDVETPWRKCWPGCPYRLCAGPGFHTRTALVRRRSLRAAGRGPSTTRRKRRHMSWIAYPSWLNRRRQRVADDRRDVRRADEPAGPGGPVRRRDAEALVGQQHDAHVRRLLARARRVGAVGVQDGLRHARSGAANGFFDTFWGKSGTVLGAGRRAGTGGDPVDHAKGRRSTSRGPRWSTSSSCSRRSRRS